MKEDIDTFNYIKIKATLSRFKKTPKLKSKAIDKLGENIFNLNHT